MSGQVCFKVYPRFVREDSGLRPFQEETLRVIKESDVKVVLVEAPVGSGKSHIIRKLAADERLRGQPIVLTYPTKILMDAQVAAFRDSNMNVSVWPEDRTTFPNDAPDAANVFKYSSDSLMDYFAECPNAFREFENRGHLLGDGLFLLHYGGWQVFVTTPDVLWLIYSKRFRGAQELQAQLSSAIVCFDEFHAYADLRNFYALLKNLIIESKVEKVVLLSATPFMRDEQWADIEAEMRNDSIQKYEICFAPSVGSRDQSDKIFNYPLEVTVHNFRYTDRTKCLSKIRGLLDEIQTPAAIIFDSISRLKHLKPRLLEFDESNGGRLKVREWSGMDKDDDVTELVSNQKNVIILGTSAIEVGVDMKFRSLITEARDWASAIQRIGRVGRYPYTRDSTPEANPGYVHLFVNSRSTILSLQGHAELSRDGFECILRQSLSSPAREMVGGELFRGESYDFILMDRCISKPAIYGQNIFCMYNVDETQCQDFKGTREDKKQVLRDSGISDERFVKWILLRDKLFPIWGIITVDGLSDDYDRIIRIEKTPDRNPTMITIQTERNPSGFTFCREKFKRSNLEDPLW